MNPSLDSSLATAIEQASKAGVSAVEFVITQAPEVCEQIIHWQIVSHTAGLCLGILMAFSSIGLYIRWDRNLRRSSEDFEIMVAAVLAFGAVILVPIHSFGLLKVIESPKLVLIEQVSQLLRR